eukprot:6835833-Alexandrium_andersonii.AAC.1
MHAKPPWNRPSAASAPGAPAPRDGAPEASGPGPWGPRPKLPARPRPGPGPRAWRASRPSCDQPLGPKA